jgi:DNA-binding NarL/FixJ family response regulator
MGQYEHEMATRSGDVGNVRVVIADDHRLMLDGIRRALGADDGFEIVGETQDGIHLVPLVEETKPDLVLLDVRMPRRDGLACLDEIHARFPETKVVMLSASTTPALIQSALSRGATAYIAKSVDPADLPSTLRQAMEGRLPGQAALSGESDPGRANPARLTEREASILSAVSRGLSNDEIATELWVTQQTVKFHLTNIYRKLGVKNRTEATRVAYQRGLVESPLYGDG